MNMNIDFKEDLFDPEQDKVKDSKKLFADEAEKEASSEVIRRELYEEQKAQWKVLVVDDEEDVHSVTRMALKGFTYKDREIQFLHTYSAKDTIKVLSQHTDIALIFLDVVMESNNAGL